MVRALLNTLPSRAAALQNPGGLSEAALIEALGRGDRELAGELCRRLEHVVVSTLYRVFGQTDSDYEDLVQASLEQIVVSLCRGKFSQACTLSTWASAVTCKIALKAIRRRKLERRLFDSSKDAETLAKHRPDSANPEAEIATRRNLQLLHWHLSRMSVKLSEVLLLHDMLGFGLKETAALTRTSHAAARSRLARGRQDLSRRLRNEPPNLRLR